MHLLVLQTGKRPPFKLQASLKDLGKSLLLKFVLIDPNGVVVIDDIADYPSRKLNLWEQTCFELFIKKDNSSEYIEFNFSPTLDWNVFYFTENRGEKNLILTEDDLERSIEDAENEMIFEFEIKKNHPLLLEKNISYNINAVAKSHTGDLFYLAIHHNPEKADFHHFESMKEKLT